MGRLGSEVKFTLAYKWQICLNIQISSAYKVKGPIATVWNCAVFWEYGPLTDWGRRPNAETVLLYRHR